MMQPFLFLFVLVAYLITRVSIHILINVASIYIVYEYTEQSKLNLLLGRGFVAPSVLTVCDLGYSAWFVHLLLQHTSAPWYLLYWQSCLGISM